MTYGRLLSLFMFALVLWPASGAGATPAADIADGLRLKMAENGAEHNVLWEEREPLNQQLDDKPAPPPARVASPLRLHGSTLRAPADRKDVAPSARAPADRFSEQRLLDVYGARGWQHLALDGQLRFHANPNQGGLAPYVMGGVGLTEFGGVNGGAGLSASSGSKISEQEMNGMLGLRYGAGLAYSLGEDFDVTAGYRVNRVDDEKNLGSMTERLNMQMLDFGLRYRY